MATLSFPEDFIWGTATAAHQVEGQNVNNDWWTYEHADDTPCVASSGDACDSWHRWPSDVALCASLGFGAYRFSLEWSRIEPAQDEWSEANLDHYRAMCATCHEHGLAPIVTFNHFTIPRWLSARGGWEAEDAPERFALFCERATRRLGDLLGWACTINEPNIVAVVGYELGIFPPAIRDDSRSKKVSEALCRAHRLATETLRSGPGGFPVGLTLSMTDYRATDGGEQKLEQIRRDAEDVFLEATEGDDFVGVQTYSRSRIGPQGVLPPERGVPLTQMGYELWPEALESTIRRASSFTGGRPVLVTENGIGTADDSQRIEFVAAALTGVKRCIDDALEVKGYIHWSLMDNFEWVLGYGPKFGLVAVDGTSFERKPKASAFWLGEIARRNSLEVA